jgi:hypothetical protein
LRNTVWSATRAASTHRDIWALFAEPYTGTIGVDYLAVRFR